MTALLLLTLFAAPEPKADYPRAEMLVEPAALKTPDAARPFLILDARPRKDYDAGHVPGAVWVDHADWAKGFQDGKDPEAWAGRIRALGLTAESRVVVYDDLRNRDAARVWWILKFWGVKDARLLNGAWFGYKASGLPVSTVAVTPKPSAFEPAAQAKRLGTKGLILQSLDGQTLQIVDARSEDERCGVTAFANKKLGTMPGAKALEWSDLIDPKTQRLLTAAEITAKFAAAGVDPKKPTVTHCQGGSRSAFVAFTIELMGGDEVRNYHASWGEWGNADDTPVVKPAAKK